MARETTEQWADRYELAKYIIANTGVPPEERHLPASQQHRAVWTLWAISWLRDNAVAVAKFCEEQATQAASELVASGVKG